MRQRQALIERIAGLRRQADAASPPPAPDPRTPPPQEVMSALERRVAHLEKLLEGFQDSVHREATRHSKQIADLEAQIEPGALVIALDKHARQRGL
jgi:hypothetical protein